MKEYEFREWLKGALREVYGDVDLYTDPELLMLFRRCELAHRNGASLEDVKNILLDHKEKRVSK